MLILQVAPARGAVVDIVCFVIFISHSCCIVDAKVDVAFTVVVVVFIAAGVGDSDVQQSPPISYIV